MGEALQLMQQATQNMTLDGTTAAQMVTMGYNLARLQEASGARLAPQLQPVSQHNPAVTSACSSQSVVPPAPLLLSTHSRGLSRAQHAGAADSAVHA